LRRRTERTEDRCEERSETKEQDVSAAFSGDIKWKDR